MTSPVNTVSISYGKYVYATTSGSIYASAIKRGSDIGSGFVQPSKLYKERTGGSHIVQSHKSGKKDLGGFSIGKTIEVPDGHIIKLVSNRKLNGHDYLDAAMLVLVHKRAGMISVYASIPDDDRNAIGSGVEVFTGTGIVLSNTDVVDFGYTMNHMFINRYRDKEELDEAFTIKEITDGASITEFSSITRDSGVIDILVKSKPRYRRIILR